MRVALDISSTKSDHRFRGIGTYTQNLWDELKIIASQDKSLELVTFNKRIPTADLYHFPAFNPFFFSFPIKLIHKSLFTIHDLIPIEYSTHYPVGLKGSLRWMVQKNLLKMARGIITDSNYSANSIHKIIAIKKEKIITIYLGVDKSIINSSNFKTTKESLSKFNLPVKYVLYVGDVNWNKNLLMLTKVCIKLKIPLIVIGKQAVNSEIDRKHPWNQELVSFQDIANKHNDLIFRYGYVDTKDLIHFYTNAACYIQPSIVEGFGLPVLEAMACGCLVLSSSGGSLPEIAGDAALYFNPLDENELKDKLLNIWQNSVNLKLQKQTSMKEQLEKFSWDKTASQTWAYYMSCLL